MMTKKEFIKALSERADLSQKGADELVKAFFETVEGALAKQGGVAFVGWGSFKLNQRAAREGRNPQTGAPMKIAAKKVVRFTAGAPLQAKFN